MIFLVIHQGWILSHPSAGLDIPRYSPGLDTLASFSRVVYSSLFTRAGYPSLYLEGLDIPRYSLGLDTLASFSRDGYSSLITRAGYSSHHSPGLDIPRYTPGLDTPASFSRQGWIFPPYSAGLDTLHITPIFLTKAGHSSHLSTMDGYSFQFSQSQDIAKLIHH